MVYTSCSPCRIRGRTLVQRRSAENTSPSGPADRPAVNTQHPAVPCREPCPGDTAAQQQPQVSKYFRSGHVKLYGRGITPISPSLRQQAAPCKQSLHRNTVAIQLPKTSTRSRNWLLNTRKENFSHQLNSSSIQDFIKNRSQAVQKHTLAAASKTGCPHFTDCQRYITKGFWMTQGSPDWNPPSPST